MLRMVPKPQAHDVPPSDPYLSAGYSTDRSAASSASAGSKKDSTEEVPLLPGGGSYWTGSASS